MPLDIELYRRVIYVPSGGAAQGEASRKMRRISVIDMHPEGATRTLVFVHGFGGGVTQWLYQLRFFGQTMRVIAPDLRGHGLSDDPLDANQALSQAYTMESMVDDLELVLERMEVREPIYLIAHSFGGAIATEFALRAPERILGLVLIGVPARFIILPILRFAITVPDPIFTRLARLLRVALFAPQRTLKHMHDRIMSLWPGSERMALLRVPTLVILGYRDNVFQKQSYEDVPRAIPEAQQVIIPVSAHLVQLERPDAVNRAIRRLIEGKQPKASGDEQRSNKGEMSAHLRRHATMPWLQYYDPEVPESLPIPALRLHDLLSNAAQEFPYRPALIFFGQKIGYRELDRLSNRFAHALRNLGVGVGERVAIVLPNIPQVVVAFYGTLKAGAVAVLGSPLSSEEELAYQLQHSGARVLLTLSSYRVVVERIGSITNIEHVIYTDVREYLPIRQRVRLASFIDEEGNAIRVLPRAGGQQSAAAQGNNGTGGTILAVRASQGSTQWKQHTFQTLLRSQPLLPVESGVTAQELALLQYTSGTTDIPKGVMLSHGNLVMNIAQIRHWIPDARRGREVVLCVLPLSHSYGITDCMNLSIALAGSMVLLPTMRTARVLEAIKAHRPSLFPGIPSLYQDIANYPRVRSYGISAIRFCISGSAPLPVEVQEAFEKLTKGHLVEGYGLTEASPVTHSNPLKGERRVGSIGLLLPETSACIADIQSGVPLAPGEVGELLIRGPQVMQGYWNMPEETREALKDGWLHTGDLAMMDEDGFFTIIDRKKDLILSGAYNVYPRDVEEVLYEHPKVLEAAVVSVAPPGKTASQDGGKVLESATSASPIIKAVVVLKRGEKASAEELLALCRERLDAYKVPRQIEFRNELPKNGVGKVLRRLLVES